MQDARYDETAQRWTVETNTGVRASAPFLICAVGALSTTNRPDIPGIHDFAGECYHTGSWPHEPVSFEGKRVAVIGSGATAITIVPNMAEDAEHVTMVQRSPTYVVSRPAVDQIAVFLRKIMPEKWAYAITRFKNVQFQRLAYNRNRTKPGKVKEMLLGMVRTELGPDYDIGKHFTPSYSPWDQRL